MVRTTVILPSYGTLQVALDSTDRSSGSMTWFLTVAGSCGRRQQSSDSLGLTISWIFLHPKWFRSASNTLIVLQSELQEAC